VFKWLAAAAVVTVTLPLALVLLVTANPATSQPSQSLAGGPSVLALNGIPPAYLALYMGAAQTCPGLPWAVLAGIGEVESAHGQSTAPGVHSGANYAGAEGPMQFEPATFTQYAVNADPGAPLTPYNPADAVYTAANMLCANGAGSGTRAGIRQAVFAYNHSWAYVSQVLSWAARYSVSAPSRAAAVAIAFAVRQVGKPYVFGAAGPNSYDCSGLVFAAYAVAGISIARTTFGWRQDGPTVPLSQIQPGDLLFSAGSDGTNADPGHVVMYLGGGQIIKTQQRGEDVQIDPLSLAGVLVATRPADLPPHA
jgi:cell wall-associated NlpC family hydrolase